MSALSKVEFLLAFGLVVSPFMLADCNSDPPAVLSLASDEDGMLRSPDHGFRVAFLEQPEISSRYVVGRPGEMPAVEFLHSDVDNNMVYMVTCHTYPDPFATSMIQQNLNAAREKFRLGSKCEFLREESTIVGEYPARECWFQKHDGIIFHCLFVFHRNRDFKVVAAFHDDDSQELAEAFIRSFAFVE